MKDRDWSHHSTVTREGRTFRVSLHDDSDMQAPWDEHDGHGAVSDWTMRDKKPGEWLLSTNHGSKRFYDAQESLKSAKRDGWGLNPEKRIELAVTLGRDPTAKEIAAQAVQSDFEYLQGWAEDRWHWVGVVVTDVTDDEDAEPDYGYACWGFSSDDDEAHQECAEGFVNQMLDETREERRLKAETDASLCPGAYDLAVAIGALIIKADALGIDISIYQTPNKPLAMGNTSTMLKLNRQRKYYQEK